MWKCPKCSYKSMNHQTMMKHYYRLHHVKKAGTKTNKGKEKKVHVFKPIPTKRK